MKTTIVIHWGYVIASVFLFWAIWVTWTLSGAIDAHNDILQRLKVVEWEQVSLESGGKAK